MTVLEAAAWIAGTWLLVSVPVGLAFGRWFRVQRERNGEP